MTDHSSKQYDIELETLRSRVLEMGGLVESQILAAINGVAAGDLHALDHVIAEDHRVNALEVSIDTDCSHLIARRQPTAGDLRMVLAVIKIVTDLERIGDEAAKIARMGKQGFSLDSITSSLPSLSDIQSFAGQVQSDFSGFVKGVQGVTQAYQKVAPAASLFGFANELGVIWRLVRWIGIVQESKQSGSGNFLATLMFKLPLDRCGIFAKPEKGQ